MNLVEIQQALQGLPDDALIKEMQMPTGTAPQYMILSELQRRKAMRMQAAPQAPTSTVRQDVAGFADGGQVENQPGWMKGGLGSFLLPGLGLMAPLLNDVADGNIQWPLGLGAPWLMKQLGFGNEGEQNPEEEVQKVNPMLQRRFDEGGAVHKVRQSESGKAGYKANNIVRDKNGKIISQAVGRDQFTISTWNDYAKQVGLPKLSYGVKPGDPEWPSKAAQDIMGSLLQNDISRALQNSGWDKDDPVARKVTTMFGISGGPKLLDAVSKNPEMRAMDALSSSMGLEAALKAIRANNIDPDAPIGMALNRFTSKVGGSLPSEMRYQDPEVSRAAFISDLKQTVNAPEDPDYLAWRAEQMNSVPAQPAWNGIAPQQPQAPMLRPNIGPPITAGGIDQVLVTPMRGKPQPWQMIQKQSGIKGFADGGAVKVKDGIEYRLNSAGQYVDATGKPYPEELPYNFLDAPGDVVRTIGTDWLGGLGGWLSKGGAQRKSPVGQTIGTGEQIVGDTLKDAGSGMMGIQAAPSNYLNWAINGSGSAKSPAAVAKQYPADFPTGPLPTGLGSFKSAPGAVVAPNATPEPSYDVASAYDRLRGGIKDRGYDTGIPSAVRDTERDKWLALAEFGSRLAAGNSPYFAQNFGPAVSAGISSYRQSQSQYDEDMMKQAELRLRQEQLNEQARGRGDTVAMNLAQAESALEGQKISAEARIRTAGLRALAKAKLGLSDKAFDDYIKDARELALQSGRPWTDELLDIMRLKEQYRVGSLPDDGGDKGGYDGDIGDN